MRDLISDIQSSDSLSSLQKAGLLPEPYTGSGFYFVYYSRYDYKPALKDIVLMTEKGLQVWYDRKTNSGKSWEEDMIEKARNFHCACVILYLSKNSMKSDFFWRLCETIKEYRLFYCTVNLPDALGKVCSGYSLAQQIGVSNERLKLAKELFNDDVTFISGTLTFDEKFRALSSVRKNEQLIYVTELDYAVVAGVKDISEEKIVIPAMVRIGDSEYAVKRIAPRAFARCRRLKEIYLPEGIEHIGDLDQKIAFDTGISHEGNVFEDCCSLEEIRFPSSLKSFNTNLFAGCVRLKRVYFGDNVMNIKSYNDCFDLTPIDYNSFNEENTLENEEATFDPDTNDCDLLNAEENEKEDPYLEELRLPPIFIRRHDGVILYPNENMGWKIFQVDERTKVYGCTDIGPQESYKAKAGEKLGSRFAQDKAIRFVDLSEADDEKNLSFRECDHLEKVILSKKLTDIDISDTFAECPSLKEIVLPKTLKDIQDYPTLNCSIEAIVSDSDVNYRLFKSESFIRNKYRMLNSLPKKILYTIFSPLIFLFGCLSMLIKFRDWYLPLIGLVFLATFPISFWYFLFRPVYKPFYNNIDVKTIYLRKVKKRPLRLKKFKLVTSDKESYDKYILKS